MADRRWRQSIKHSNNGVRMSQKLCLNRLTKLRKVKKLLLVGLVSVCCAAMAQSEPTAGDSVQSMRDKYLAITPQLKQNQFSRPLVLESEEAENQLRGDVYAVVDYPLSVVNTGLNNPEHCCVCRGHGLVKQRLVPQLRHLSRCSMK